MVWNSKLADFALIFTAIIWGTGFIGTEFAIETGAKASLIIAMRFLIAGILLGIVYFKEIIKIDLKTLKVGFIAGFLLFISFYAQTFGQAITTVSNSSFITSANVIMIPFIVWAFTKERPAFKYFILAFTCMLGIGVLTLNFSEAFKLNFGDIFIFISAIGFAFHISYLGTFAKDINSKQLTFLQMIVTGVLAFLFMCIFDSSALDFEIFVRAIPSTTYLAIFSSCICYYLQTTAQKYTSTAKVGIFLSTEGLFGSIFAVMIGMDVLTKNLILGGFIIVASVILSEVNFTLFRKK